MTSYITRYFHDYCITTRSYVHFANPIHTWDWNNWIDCIHWNKSICLKESFIVSFWKKSSLYDQSLESVIFFFADIATIVLVYIVVGEVSFSVVSRLSIPAPLLGKVISFHQDNSLLWKKQSTSLTDSTVLGITLELVLARNTLSYRTLLVNVVSLVTRPAGSGRGVRWWCPSFKTLFHCLNTAF